MLWEYVWKNNLIFLICTISIWCIIFCYRKELLKQKIRIKYLKSLIFKKKWAQKCNENTYISSQTSLVNRLENTWLCISRHVAKVPIFLGCLFPFCISLITLLFFQLLHLRRNFCKCIMQIRFQFLVKVAI